MIFRNTAGRSFGLPYSIPEGLPERPLYGATSRRSNLVPRRLTTLLPRGSTSSNLKPGYIALIVILVLVSIASLIALTRFLYRRRRGKKTLRPQIARFCSPEKGRRRSWQQYGNEWFGKKSYGEDGESLVGGYQSRMPNIIISRPMSNNTTLGGPTPIFSTQDRESLHSIGIAELPDNSQPPPEAVYDPYIRSRSRSRSNSAGESVDSSPTSRSSSPNTYITRSREVSITSNNSPPYSNNRSSRPLARNSYTYARSRSLSNGTSSRGVYQNASILPTTDEEYSIAIASASLSDRQKSLPPLPSTTRSDKNNTLLNKSSNSSSWQQADPHSSFNRDRPRFDFSEYEVLQETTQVIDIAIAGPLDVPTGPLTPFGEREAKAGAALGKQSTWYKSPQNVEKGIWLV